ncbi:MAG: KamA family radical SAM protein [Thermodesulfobacteriota bacterium]
MARPLRKTEPSESNLARALPDELIPEPHRHPEYGDWKWQIKNRISSLEDIEPLIKLTRAEKEGIKRSGGRLKMAITPYFFSLIDKNKPTCPIRRQAVPRVDEFGVSSCEMVDPCGEDSHSPTPGLVHRYPDRVLLIVTDACAMYCRYCTRKRMVGEKHPPLNPEQFERAYKYIKSRKTIRDVLISGGDPLMLDTKHLERYIKRLSSIEHLDMIRIGTRIPVTLPMRVDRELVDMLKKYHPLYMSIHFSHPKEITPEVERACTMLADAGIPLGSQTVLLKGINDDAAIMKKLVHGLLKIRVRPYYLYQCDLAFGTEHFRTPISVGTEIIEKLRGHTTGYAAPTFVVDAPGGGGKIAVGPDNIVSREEGRIKLRNYEGKIFEYVEPQGPPAKKR